MSSSTSAREILDFWFGPEADDQLTANRQAKLWWSKNPEIDRQIRERFEPSILAASSGRETYSDETKGELARIILLDQFPRNIYRNDPRAFSFDEQALDWCLEGLARSADQGLRPVERVFFYLPLEHSENLGHQERSVDLFGKLVGDVAESHRETFSGFLDYAVRHRDIIARFKRFPHRNAILGRTSTEEEIEFLKQPGSSF